MPSRHLRWGTLWYICLPCRPFYVSTTTSNPRDVVVVLELSDSMGGDKWFQASNAALTVMETLSVQDRVSISNCLR